jgi:hypothetical protein
VPQTRRRTTVLAALPKVAVEDAEEPRDGCHQADGDAHLLAGQLCHLLWQVEGHAVDGDLQAEVDDGAVPDLAVVHGGQDAARTGFFLDSVLQCHDLQERILSSLFKTEGMPNSGCRVGTCPILVRDRGTCPFPAPAEEHARSWVPRPRDMLIPGSRRGTCSFLGPATEGHAHSRLPPRNMLVLGSRDRGTCSFLNANSGQNGILPTVRGSDGTCPAADELLRGPSFGRPGSRCSPWRPRSRRWTGPAH